MCGVQVGTRISSNSHSTTSTTLHCCCIHPAASSVSLTLATSHTAAISQRSNDLSSLLTYFLSLIFSKLFLLSKPSWILMYVSLLGLCPHFFNKCSHIKPTSPVRLVLTLPFALVLRRLLLAILFVLLVRLLARTLLSLLTIILTLLLIDRLQIRLWEQNLIPLALFSRLLKRLLARLKHQMERLLAHPLPQSLVLLPLLSPPEAKASPLLHHIPCLVRHLQTP